MKTRLLIFGTVLVAAVVCPLSASAATLPPYIDLAQPPGGEGTPFTRGYPGEGDGFGAGNQAVAVADFNGDGFDDYAVGFANYAPPAFPGASRGRVIIIYGGEAVSTFDFGAAGQTIIVNQDDNAQFGYSLATGDVTDDGLPDLVIGAPGSRSGKGVVMIIENDDLDTPGATFDVTTDQTNPLSGESRYVGVEEGSSYGTSVACLDTTGDGAFEIAGGAPNSDGGKGAVYVAIGANYVSGMTLEITSDPELYTITGGTGFGVGSALAGGDFDGNGISDLAVGAFGADQVYGFFDISPGPNSIDVSDSGSLSMLLRLTGYDSLGFALAAGDVNADGLEDLILGAPLYTPEAGREQAGIAIVLRGRANFSGQDLDLTNNAVPGWNYFVGGETNGTGAGFRLGASVGLGDINGDGFADVLMGAPFAPTLDGEATFAGRVFGVYGGPFLSSREFQDIGGDFEIYGGAANDFLGASFDATGDLNRDGFADFLLTAGFAPNEEANGTGQVHTLYGAGNATSAAGTYSMISGDTQRQGLGGALSPVLRVTAKFMSGNNSTFSGTLTRSSNALSNLGNGFGTNIAPVTWNLTTTRTGWTSASLTFDFTDAELVGFDKSKLAMFQASDPAGPWTELAGATVDATANRITATVTTLGYFAVITKSPVITLSGALQTTLECGEPWEEPGYSAVSANGVDLTDAVAVGGDSIGETQPGEAYSITYDVDDGQGNSAATVTRTVEIVDTTPPVFTSTNNRTVEAGSVYVDSFTVEDCEDLTGQVVATGDVVDTNVLGNFTRFYDVTDSSGNVAEQFRVDIYVEDSTPPVITLNGDDTIEIPCGGSYTELGATVSDWDANVEAVTIAQDINTSLAGTYFVNYNVIDPSGNNAQEVIRTVNVIDTEKPVISLSYYTTEVNCGSSGYSLPLVTVDDCQPGLAFAVVRGGEGAVDLNTLGTYPITYDVSDAAGNAADQVTLEVNVVDKVKPVITIQGNNPIQLSCGDTYVDAGATATDNCGGLAGPVEVVVNNVNTDVAGFYQVNYQVSDLNGNVAGATRSVQVVGLCGTGVVDECPAESDVSYRPLDNTIINGIAQPSEDGLDTLFEYYYSLDNPPVGTVTWWGYGRDIDGLPCERTPNSFRIAFYDSLSLQTGVIPFRSAIYFEDVTPVVEDAGFVTFENIPLLRYTATLAQPLSYRAGECCAQMFISIKGLGNPDCPFQWYISNDDGGFHLSGPDAENTTEQNTGDLAFCLEPAPAVEGEGEEPPANHAADPNGNNIIDLSELTRVIQFYNADYYGCLFGTEDGYGIEEPLKYCGYHSSDYNPADWQIRLSELLRLIQFFNYGGYEPCPDQSEDGYCPVVK